MDIERAYELIGKYDIPYPKYLVFRELDEIKDKFYEVGFPLVLKVFSKNITHKSDLGGVRVGIKSWEELKKEFALMDRRFSHFQDRKYIIQTMVTSGIEVALGGIKDKIFGPTVMFGLGGIFIEIYKDVSFRLAPITVKDALEMIDEIKGKKILEGFRGYPPVDKQSLANILVALSKLIYSHNEILEIDINPLICHGKEMYAVDVRVITGIDNE